MLNQLLNALSRPLAMSPAPILALILANLALPTYAVPGALDASFGSAGTGKVLTSIGTGRDVASSLALQPDGKIVVAGYCSNGTNNDFCLARYLASGSLDATFNTTGIVITPIGNGEDYATSIALQPDGKIVVAGYCAISTSHNFCLARYLTNGMLDTSFNSIGYVITPIGEFDDIATSVALQPDGTIIVAGVCYNGANSNDFCLARYLANGALDASFNSTGTVITPIGSGSDTAQSLSLQPDGKIIVAGYCSNGGNNDFCLARYLANGTLDASFNSTGTVITPIGSGSRSDTAQSLSLQPDGKIIVAGYCANAFKDDFCLARYLASGALDTSFNGTGKVITPIGSSRDRAQSLSLQPDGKIIVAGYCSTGANNDFCLTRYLTSGALDTSFNGSGKVTTPIGSGDDNATSIALQPDGKIVVAGYCNGGTTIDFCLARYEGGPFGAQNCSLDIDGDGRVTATTDMLIATRIAQGTNTSAAINGISFPANAKRNTWPQIRGYLSLQCGMSLVP